MQAPDRLRVPPLHCDHGRRTSRAVGLVEGLAEDDLTSQRRGALGEGREVRVAAPRDDNGASCRREEGRGTRFGLLGALPSCSANPEGSTSLDREVGTDSSELAGLVRVEE